MRISLSSILLLGTALAAPLQEVDRFTKQARYENFSVRGLVPLLERAVVPLKSVRPANPGPPPPPPRLNGPDTPADGPDTPGLRPNQPESVPNPDEPSAPGVRPNEPQSPKPPARGDGCFRKRCFKQPPESSRPTVRDNYHRDQDPIEAVNDKPNAAYLRKAGFEDTDQWYTTIINNDLTVRDAFNAKWNDQRAQLLNDGWNPEDVNKVKNAQDAKFGDDADPILTTLENTSKGTIVAKQSYNKDRDLRNPHEDYVMVRDPTTRKRVKKFYTRPAVGESGLVYWSEMVMDNWRTAATAQGVHVKTLKYIGRDNIVTDETKEVFATHMGSATTMIFRPNDAGYAAIARTPHGKGPARMLRDFEDELGRKEIASFEVELNNGVYNMLITLRSRKR